MDPLVGSVSTSWQDVDELIATLRAWGITYLVGLEPATLAPKLETEQQSVVTFLQRLAQCDEYPRVRDAIISLLLLHPELAPAMQVALRESQPGVAEQIAVLTLATLYLQRLWSLRLTMALGHVPGLPEQPFEFLWENRRLPPPACHYGICGLLALEEYEQKRSGLPFTFTGDWQNQINQLLAQEEAQHHAMSMSLLSVASAATKTTEYCEEELCMSMRRGVDKAAIESFLQPPLQGEIYAQILNRYRTIDVFYFDFYSIALSKMERGNNRDIADVKLLIQHGLITLDELNKAYQEVLAQLGKGRYPRITPQRFAERYQAVRQLL